MILIDAALLLLALLCAAPMLYGIYAGHQRARGVEVPAFGTLLRDGWAMVAPVLRGVAWVVGFVLAPARPRPPAPWDMSSNEGGEWDDEGIVGADNGFAKGPLQPIATLQNGNNDAVVIVALARLVASGDVTQTAAIKVGMGIAPSSTSVRYAEVRNALRAEVERIKGAGKPDFRLTDEQRQWRRSMGLEETA